MSPTFSFSFRASALALAALLAGCASSSHYAEQVPPLEVPADYGRGRDTSGVSAPALSAPATLAPETSADVRANPWWRGFGDERLARMVDQALAANANLSAAGFALRRARLEVGLASNAQRPQPTAGLESSLSRELDGGSSQQSHRLQAGLSWEADLFGRLAAQRDVQAWRAQASADDLQATALALVGDVCRYYWTLAYLNQSIRAGEQDLAALARIQQLVEVQHAEGDVSRLEPREAQQRLETRRAAQDVLLQERVEVRNALAVLLDGQHWPQHDEPASLEALQTLTVREGLPAELLGRRPDLRAAERRLRASLAEVDVTMRSYYPSLSLTGALGGSSIALSDVVRHPAVVLGASLNLPFLNVARMRLSTEAAGVSYLQAASGFRTTLHTALQDVDNALSARQRLQAQREARERAHQAAQEVARMYEARYREGASPLRTWLDAQQELRSAELALAQALRDQAGNDVKLALALGGA